jgi:hypothetical protein
MRALDFDDTMFRDVKYWALRAYDWFKLEGGLIMKSSDVDTLHSRHETIRGVEGYL